MDENSALLPSRKQSRNIVEEHELEENYSPPSSTTSSNKCTVLQASNNLINVLLGAGMFYLPYTCYLMGWMAVVPIVTFGTICIYAFSLIAQCINAYITSKPYSQDVVSFADLGEAAFGYWGGKLCLLSLTAEFILASVSMLINIGVNIHSTFPTTDVTLCILIAAILAFALSCIDDMRLFSYISSSGNAIITISFIILVISGTQFLQLQTHPSQDYYKTLDVNGIPLSLGLIVFCYGGIGAFPKVYLSLANRTEYPKLLLLSGAAIIGAYCAVTIAGYGLYGRYTLMPVTNNIGMDELGLMVSGGAMQRSVAALGIAFNLQVTVPLIYFALKDLILSMTSNKAIVSAGVKNLVGLGIATICLLLAIVFHSHFAALCSLVGSIATSLNSVCLPIVFYHRLCPRSVTHGTWVLHTVILLVVGLSSLMGISTNLCRMYETKEGLCRFL